MYCESANTKCTCSPSPPPPPGKGVDMRWSRQSLPEACNAEGACCAYEGLRELRESCDDAGDVAAVVPMPPEVAVWLLNVAGQQPANAQRASWALPLAVGALHRTVPQPAPSAWSKVCGRHGMPFSSSLRICYPHLVFPPFAPSPVCS